MTAVALGLAPRPLPALSPKRGTVCLVEDDAWIGRAADGDEHAFRHLFRIHRESVSRLVHRMVGRTADHEDLVQEVFLQVHRSLRDFRGQARFTTWLYRVTVNVVLMYRRAARSRPLLVEEQLGAAALDVEALPDEQAATRERIQAFRRLIDRLPEKKRVVFVLHELEGVAPAEIARIVGAPVLTVRTRLFYARRELEAMLADEPALSRLLETIPAGRRSSPSLVEAPESSP